MNDLNTLLDRAAGAGDGTAANAAVDAHADLTRGRRALARTRRRRGAVGLVGVAAAGVVGVGISRYALPESGSDGPTTAVESTRPGAADAITFLAQPLEAGPYTFDTTPEGWEVQGADDFHVTIAPVGFADQDPSSFEGKLAILFDANPLFGEKVQQDGRTFWVNTSNSGTTIVATPSLAGEPTGHVLIQVPDSTGWDQESMLTFLGSVHVGAGAQAGVG